MGKSVKKRGNKTALLSANSPFKFLKMPEMHFQWDSKFKTWERSSGPPNGRGVTTFSYLRPTHGYLPFTSILLLDTYYNILLLLKIFWRTLSPVTTPS